MKSARIRVRFTEQTLIELNKLTLTGEINCSTAVNEMASLFSVFIEDNYPDLCEAKKIAFAMAYNGYMPSNDINQEAKVLHWHVSEGYENDTQIKNTLDSAGIVLNEFVEEIKGWSLSQKISVICTAKAFFRNNTQIVV